jgi:hypothetical protein
MGTTVKQIVEFYLKEIGTDGLIKQSMCKCSNEYLMKRCSRWERGNMDCVPAKLIDGKMVPMKKEER